MTTTASASIRGPRANTRARCSRAPSHSSASTPAGPLIRVIEGRRHEAEDQMQGQGAKEGDAVDVAVEEFAAEGEKGAVEDEE